MTTHHVHRLTSPQLDLPLTTIPLETPGPTARADWAELLASIEEADATRRRRSFVLVNLSTKLPTFTPTATETTPFAHFSRDDADENLGATWEDLPFHDEEAIASHDEPTAEEKPTLMCCICYEPSVPLSASTMSLHAENPCGSESAVCRGCAFAYLKVKIQERAVGAVLTCPGGCSAVLTPSDVHNFLTVDSADANAELLVVFNEAQAATEAVVSARDRRLSRCLPSMKDVAQDVNFALWRWGRDVRRCPGCKIPIEKNGGCPHMTCRACRYEFWWCCGQNHRGRHSKAFCFPAVAISQLSHHPSRYWGPVLPVRAVTKVTAFGVGLGLGVAGAAVAAVAVPLYLGYELLDEETGIRNWRQNRRRSRERAAAAAAAHRQQLQAAATRAAQEQHANELRHRLALDLKGALNEDFAVTVDDIRSLEAAAPYSCEQSCGLCTSCGFRRPQDMIQHLALHALSDLPISVHTADGTTAGEALRAEMQRTRLIGGCAVFESLEISDEDSAEVSIARNELADLRQLRDTLRPYREAEGVASAAGQRCLCRVEPATLDDWCDHLVRRNPRRVATFSFAPAACGVVVRPGVLCPCRSCVAPGVICAGCLHPRMLHQDTIRGNSSPVDKNTGFDSTST